MTVCCVLFSEHTVCACPEELKCEAEGDKMEKNEDPEIRGKAFEIDRERNKMRQGLRGREGDAGTKTFSHQIKKKKQGRLQGTRRAYQTSASSFSLFLFLPFFPYLCILFCLNPFLPQSSTIGSESSEPAVRLEFTIPVENAGEAAAHRCQPDGKGY